MSALLTGWIRHARRLGVIVIWAVSLWGAAVAVVGVRFSVASGGLACLAGVAAIVAAFPALARYDAADWIPPQRRSTSCCSKLDMTYG